jgi:hypothetical protein
MFLVRVLVVFAFNLLEVLLRWVIRTAFENHASRLSPEEQVLLLEQQRRTYGYQPGWVWHRCRELGLEGAYERVREQGYFGG